MSAPVVFDAHAHVWPAHLRHPAQASETSLPCTATDLCVDMIRAGIQRAVVLPASIHPDNVWLRGEVDAATPTLVGVAAIDPWTPAALTELEAASRAGFRGVRFIPAALSDRADSDPGPLDAAIDAAADLGLVVQWTVRLRQCAPILRARGRRPDLRMVIDHLGLPDLPEGDVGLLLDLASHPGTHVKLSGFYAIARELYPYRDAWSWAERTLVAFGPERTMWASDWPLVTESASYSRQVALLDELPFLDERALEHVRYATASRVWGIDPP